MATTRPKRCAHEGCTADGVKSTAVWSRYRFWTRGTFCPEHYPAAKAAAVERRLETFVGPYAVMRTWTMESFPAADPAGAAAKDEVEVWLDNGWDDNLFVSGPMGSGKTGLAFAAGRTVIESNPDYDVRFANVKRFLDDLRDSYGRRRDEEDEEEEDPLAALIAADLLVLDDVGAERGTDWARDVLLRIVDRRYVARRPMLVTSNYRPKELAQRIGHDDPSLGLRIVSRLIEDAVQVRLERADLRMRHPRLEAV
jgi:chromosomal replication initiation ATPase DnaA